LRKKQFVFKNAKMLIEFNKQKTGYLKSLSK